MKTLFVFHATVAAAIMSEIMRLPYQSAALAQFKFHYMNVSNLCEHVNMELNSIGSNQFPAIASAQELDLAFDLLHVKREHMQTVIAQFKEHELEDFREYSNILTGKYSFTHAQIQIYKADMAYFTTYIIDHYKVLETMVNQLFKTQFQVLELVSAHYGDVYDKENIPPQADPMIHATYHDEIQLIGSSEAGGAGEAISEANTENWEILDEWTSSPLHNITNSDWTADTTTQEDNAFFDPLAMLTTFEWNL